MCVCVYVSVLCVNPHLPHRMLLLWACSITAVSALVVTRLVRWRGDIRRYR